MTDLKIARGRGRASSLINAITRNLSLTPMSPMSSPPKRQFFLNEQFKPYHQTEQLTPATTPTKPLNATNHTNPNPNPNLNPNSYLPSNQLIQFEDCDDDDDKCAICDRPKANIICKNCGKIWKGRVRVSCPVHKNQVFLMDFDACIGCQSSELKEV